VWFYARGENIMNYYFGDSHYTIHVDDANGNDTNDGKSFTNAKKTINSALTACPDGGVIVIWPGTYNEQIDLLTAAKTITLLGMSRSKSIITQSGSNETISTTYDSCRLENLTVKQTGTGRCVHISGKDSLVFIDCDFICSGDMVIDGSAGYKASFKNCYLFGENDTIFMGEELIIDGCILVTDGTYPGSGNARIIRCASDFTAKILVKDSILYAQPSYRKSTGKSPELYESERSLYCIYGNTEGELVVLENSILIADGYKPDGAHASSYCSGDVACISLIDRFVAKNCIFFSRTDQNQSAADAYGLRNCSAQINNCTILVSGTDASYDFYADTAHTIHLVNTRYNASQIGANVTVNAVPAGMTFEKAAKSLVNKAIQNKNTGAIDYYDDDEQTILFTHTPTDDESTITRTPG
jgi:hypothetical protein